MSRHPQQAAGLRLPLGRRRRDIRNVTIALLVTGTLGYLAFPSNEASPARGARQPAQQIETARTPSPSSSAPTMQAAPAVSLVGLTWKDYQGVRLPWSTDDGPHTSKDDLASGFSQTPRGALLAAIHITARANAVWGPRIFEPTIAQQVTGPDATELADQTRQAYEQQRRNTRLPYGRPLGRAYVTIEGFRWLDYTPDLADLDLLTAGPGDSDTTVRAVTRILLHWREGDWRVVGPPNGNWAESAAPVESADGYIRFPQGR
jgi:hypothetical protein